jgi:hypothetical protein
MDPIGPFHTSSYWYSYLSKAHMYYRTITCISSKIFMRLCQILCADNIFL